MSVSGPQQAPALPQEKPRSGTAATVVAVLAVLLLVVVALAVVFVGMFLPMAAANCGIGDTDGLPICSPLGQLVILLAPITGAVLGVLVSLVGFFPIPLPRRRLIFISAGYLLTLGGLGLAFLVAFSG